MKIKRTAKVKSSKILILGTIFSLLSFSFAISITYAGSVSSTELINNARDLDGKTITYEGEVIGDIMARGGHAWVNLNDGNNAIGVWIDKPLVQEILYRGSYKFKGDRLEVAGIFHRACLEHGGDLDIHAQHLSKIKSGYPVTEILNCKKVNLAVFLLFILLTLWILRQLKTK
jgi:hypothetical protein